MKKLCTKRIYLFLYSIVLFPNIYFTISQGTPYYPVKGKNDYPDSNRDHTAAYLCCCSFWLLLPRLIRCCPPVIWVHKSRTSTAMIYRQRPCHCVCLRTVNLKAENTAKHWYLLVLRGVSCKWYCVSNTAIWCCGMMFWRCWGGCYIDCHCDMPLWHYAVISGGLQ